MELISEHLWKIFRIYFTEVGAAGGLVRHTSGRYLFIEKKGRLDLPKGHIEPEKKPEDCALREVSEECGITGHSIIKPICASLSYLYLGRNFISEKDKLVPDAL